MARHYTRLIVVIVIATIIASLLEGGSMSGLMLVATVLASGQGLEKLQEFGQLGQILVDMFKDQGVEVLVIVLFVSILIGQLLKSVAGYWAKRWAVDLKIFLRKEAEERVINKIMNLRYEEIMRYPPGELSIYVTAASAVGKMVVSITTLLFDISMLLAYVVVMFFVSTKMTILVLISLVMLSYLFTIFVRKIHAISKKIFHASVDHSSLHVEMLNNPRLLRVLGATNEAATAIAKQRKKLMDEQRANEVLNLLVAPISEFIILVGAAAILLTAYFLGDGDRDAGQILAQAVIFIIVLNRMLPRAKAINSFRVTVAEVAPAFKQLAPFLTNISTFGASRENPQDHWVMTSITFEDVWFRYLDAKEDTIRKMSFEIPWGTTMAFVGTSGVGKSTVADLVLGLIEPSHGRILIGDQELSRIDKQLWRAKVGVVDQSSGLLNMSIRENIIYPQVSANQDLIIAACKAANIHDFISGEVDGYSKVVGKNGYRLSAGQRQRLILARALFRKPSILILDEATNALDAASEQLINESVERLRGKCTVIMITHQLRLVKQADQILFLEDGENSARGTFQELLKTSTGFRNLWERQRPE